MYINWLEELIKQCVEQCVLMWVPAPKIVTKWVSSRPVESKKFSPVVQTIAYRSSWRPLHCLEKQSRDCQGTLVVDRWSGQCIFYCSFFFFCFSLCDNLLRLFSPGKLLRGFVSPNNPQHLPIIHVTLDLSKSLFSRVFWGKLSRKHDFLGIVFVFRFIFLSLTPYLSTIGTLLLWDGFCQTADGFRWFMRWQDVLFLLNFPWSWVSSWDRPLLLSLSVGLCLISPDLATYPVALHKQIVSDVIRRLSTFAGLVLHILVPIFWGIFTKFLPTKWKFVGKVSRRCGYL